MTKGHKSLRVLCGSVFQQCGGGREGGSDKRTYRAIRRQPKIDINIVISGKFCPLAIFNIFFRRGMFQVMCFVNDGWHSLFFPWAQHFSRSLCKTDQKWKTDQKTHKWFLCSNQGEWVVYIMPYY